MTAIHFLGQLMFNRRACEYSVYVGKTFRGIARLFVVLPAILTGCTSFEQAKDCTLFPVPISSAQAEPHKKLLVFLDGTGNNPASKTNVWRLFKMVSEQNRQDRLCLYVTGVGSTENDPLGLALGHEMKPRICAAYTFLSNYYKHGDDIYIFGFSRGAHEARSLAGIISYDGLLPATLDEGQMEHNTAKIWQYTKRKEKLCDACWRMWENGGHHPFTQPHPFAAEIKDKLKLDMISADVKFVGLWDTVPGAAVKEYEACGEKEGLVGGERYHSQPYPPIVRIAHAMALDEQRSRFRPLFVRNPIDPQSTRLDQVWFPGAHSDIGGGYTDSDALSGLSMNWMLDLLKDEHLFTVTPAAVPADFTGLAHDSLHTIGPNAIGSHLEKRTTPSCEDCDVKVTFDPSVSARAGLTVLANGKSEPPQRPIMRFVPSVDSHKEILIKEPYDPAITPPPVANQTH